MNETHIEKLRELDRRAASHLCDKPGKNVVAKLGAAHQGRHFEVTITRTRSGFYAAAKVNGHIHSRLCKYASGAFLLLCSNLREVLN